MTPPNPSDLEWVMRGMARAITGLDLPAVEKIAALRAAGLRVLRRDTEGDWVALDVERSTGQPAAPPP